MNLGISLVKASNIFCLHGIILYRIWYEGTYFWFTQVMGLSGVWFSQGSWYRAAVFFYLHMYMYVQNSENSETVTDNTTSHSLSFFLHLQDFYNMHTVCKVSSLQELLFLKTLILEEYECMVVLVIYIIRTPISTYSHCQLFNLVPSNQLFWLKTFLWSQLWKSMQSYQGNQDSSRSHLFLQHITFMSFRMLKISQNQCQRIFDE